MQYKTLYVPVEFKSREYLAKLLFSLHAAEAGFDVVTGGNLTLEKHLPSLPKGLFLEKSVFSANAYWVRELRLMGHAIAAWCEEGLCLLDNDIYCIKRIDDASITEIELFIAWGENQAEAIRHYRPEQAHKIQSLGNPRLDLLRAPYRRFFEPEANRLQEQYGEYVLLNSSFQHSNNMRGEGYFLEQVERYKGPQQERYKAFFRQWDRQSKESFRAYLELLALLDRELKGKRLVVRPHPAEEIRTWQKAAEGLKNVSVVYEGSALPWILGAKAVIHNNCTTGVEAYLMDKPVLSYKPEGPGGMAMELAASVSLNAYTPQEVVDGLRRMLSEDAPSYDWLDEEDRRVIERYIPGKGGGACSDRICQQLIALAREMEENPDLTRLPPLKYAGFAAGRALRLLRVALGRIRGRHKYYDAIYRHKFPGLALDEIKADAASLASLAGRFQDVSIEEIAGHAGCFMLQRKNSS